MPRKPYLMFRTSPPPLRLEKVGRQDRVRVTPPGPTDGRTRPLSPGAKTSNVRSHPQASSRFFPVWQDDFEVVRRTCAPSLATNHLSGACRWDSWPWVLTC